MEKQNLIEEYVEKLVDAVMQGEMHWDYMIPRYSEDKPIIAEVCKTLLIELMNKYEHKFGGVL